MNELNQLNPYSGKHHANSHERHIRLINTKSSYITVTVRWIKDEGYLMKGVLTLMRSGASESYNVSLFNAYMVSSIDDVIPKIKNMAGIVNDSMGTDFKLTRKDNG